MSRSAPADSSLVRRRSRPLLSAIIVGLILFFAFLGGYVLSVAEQTRAQTGPAPSLYGDIPVDATLIRLDKRALEEAYEQQLVKLFSVWLTQGAQDSGPITTGLRNARRAYNIAATQISKREQQLLEGDRDRQDRPQGPAGPAGPPGPPGPAGPRGEDRK